MEIQKVDFTDLDDAKRFVSQVSEVDVLPHFNDQGKAEYKARVLADIVTTFDIERFQTIKAVCAGKIVGFGGRTITGHNAKYVNSPQTKMLDAQSNQERIRHELG